MISSFFVNISIMISFTFLWHQLFKKNQLTLKSGYKLKMIDGIIAGIFGILLMHYSLTINTITILDLRHIAIAMVAFYGGIIPAVIASVIIIMGRYVIDINFSSHVALVMILLIGTGTGLISQYLRLSTWKKWTVLLLYSQVIFTSAFVFVSPDKSEIVIPAILHAFSSIAGGYLVIYFALYIRNSTEAFYQLQQTSYKDHLTGLYNVRAYDHFFNEFSENNKQLRQHFSLLIIDVDFFKKINDAYGHQAGDEILIKLAQLINKEAGQRGKVFRKGGEEFTVLLNQCSYSESVEIAHRLQKTISKHKFYINNAEKISITISIGISSTEREKTEHLFESADHALYIAKKSGRNQVCEYDTLTDKHY
nr:diguanylate cyclase [Jeotgalibacillus malaysiensis]